MSGLRVCCPAYVEHIDGCVSVSQDSREGHLQLMVQLVGGGLGCLGSAQRMSAWQAGWRVGRPSDGKGALGQILCLKSSCVVNKAGSQQVAFATGRVCGAACCVCRQIACVL